MKILVVNCGSSSLKYQLIDSATEEVSASGQCERIGLDGIFSIKVNGKKIEKEVDIPNHSLRHCPALTPEMLLLIRSMPC